MRASERDTIVAIATAQGEAAIGIVRLSGAEAISISEGCFKGRRRLSQVPNRKLSHGYFEHSGQNLDEVLACVMRAPHSYTGENTVEFHCHGGPFLLRKIQDALIQKGARAALPGEYTKRAFLNGKLDLSQAEAVADMIHSQSDLSLKSAYFQLRGGLRTRFEAMAESLRHGVMLLEAGLDFSEDVEIDRHAISESIQATLCDAEGLIASYTQGKMVRDGVVVTLAGRPNVGKSSLMNRLLEEDRAIVTDIPGTTRDTLEERIDLEGLTVTLVDTAGIRKTEDPVEIEGTMRSQRSIDRAALVLYIVDGSVMPMPDDRSVLEKGNLERGLLVLNKCDLGVRDGWKSAYPTWHRMPISAKTGEGIQVLRRVMRQKLLGSHEPQAEVVTHERQVLALKKAKEGLEHAREGLQIDLPGELVAMELRMALEALSEIIGQTTSDDVLDRIFKTFCIGK